MKELTHKPDFFSIGPAKSGTSWQLHHFSRHPQIQEPLIKDLNFFDEADLTSFIQNKKRGESSSVKYGNYFDLYTGTNLKDFESVLSLRKIQQKENYDALVNLKNLRSLNFKAIKYGLRFRALNRELNQKSLEGYCKNLFEPENGKISCDLSTNYFNLSQPAIRLVAENFPKLKIIIGVRNPVERRWSYLRMEQKNQEKNNKTMPIDPKMAELPDPDSDYKSAITNWTSYFPMKQIHFAFFDELEKDPINYLKAIYNFLEIDFKAEMVDSTYRNKGREVTLPKETETILRKNNLPQYEFLSAYFPDNPYIRNWKLDQEVKLRS